MRLTIGLRRASQAALFLLACSESRALAEPPLRLEHKAPDPSFSMMKAIMRSVPILQHERQGRWPMILWQAGSFAPQPKEVYQQLLARGLTQHIHMDEKMIP